MPTPRATACNKHRKLAAAASSRSPIATSASWKKRRSVDLDKLGQALELAKMAKLAVMRRTPRRAEAMMWGEPMRPIDELCAVGVDLHRAPREAIDDFLQNRAEPRKEDLPPRSRGRGNARYLTRTQRHRVDAGEGVRAVGGFAASVTRRISATRPPVALTIYASGEDSGAR